MVVVVVVMAWWTDFKLRYYTYWNHEEFRNYMSEVEEWREDQMDDVEDGIEEPLER